MARRKKREVPGGGPSITEFRPPLIERDPRTHKMHSDMASALRGVTGRGRGPAARGRQRSIFS